MIDIFKFIDKIFNKDGKIVDCYLDMMSTKNNLFNLALEIGFNKIADIVSKCPIDVISCDADALDCAYRLNVKPNKNEYATHFWKKVVLKMLKNEECLIVQLNDRSIYCAESFQENNSIFLPKTYTNVVLNDGTSSFTLDRTFTSENAIKFRYQNKKLVNLLKQVAHENEIAWNVALAGIKRSSPKLIFRFPHNVVLKDSKTNEVIDTNELVERYREKFSSEDLTAIMMSNGIDVDTLENKNILSSTDVKTLKDEVFSTVAIALGIPKSVFYGEVTEKSDANNEFITYAIEPIFEELNDGMCACWLNEAAWKKGDRIMFDTSSIKHIDVIEHANYLDKLYSNGWSHNDILKLLKRPAISEEWASKRRFTKNYSSNDELKGGE